MAEQNPSTNNLIILSPFSNARTVQILFLLSTSDPDVTEVSHSGFNSPLPNDTSRNRSAQDSIGSDEVDRSSRIVLWIALSETMSAFLSISLKKMPEMSVCVFGSFDFAAPKVGALFGSSLA